MVPDRLENSCAGDGLQFKSNIEWDGKFLHGSKGWATTKSRKSEWAPAEFSLTSYLYCLKECSFTCDQLLAAHRHLLST